METPIEREQVIRLSNQDQILFFDALETPPKPNKAVKEAVAMYREIVDDKG